MSLRIRFRFDGRCSVHPRYNPEKDERPQHRNCLGCESLWVIYLYTGIARRKAEAGEGILASGPPLHASTTASPAEIDADQIDSREQPETENGDAAPIT